MNCYKYFIIGMMVLIATGDEAFGACSESQMSIHYEYLEGLTGKAFSLFINQDGDAEFNGERIARPGKHHEKLSRATMNALTSEIQSSRLFDMKNWYGPPPNDSGRIDLTICFRGRSKRISYEQGAAELSEEHTPPELLALGQAILASIGVSRWPPEAINPK